VTWAGGEEAWGVAWGVKEQGKGWGNRSKRKPVRYMGIGFFGWVGRGGEIVPVDLEEHWGASGVA